MVVRCNVVVHWIDYIFWSVVSNMFRLLLIDSEKTCYIIYITTMDLLSHFRSLSKLEMVILALFAVYIAVDIKMPESIASYIDSPLGMVGVLLVALFLFVYYNPILGVVGLFVAYEVVRRSARMNNRVPMMTYVPTQAKKDAEIAEMNPSVPTTLEEEMVAQMAPIGKSSLITYVSSDYKPVAENVHNASMMM